MRPNHGTRRDTPRPPRAAFPALLMSALIVWGTVACTGEPPSQEAAAGPDDVWLTLEGGWLLDVEAGERIPNLGIVVSPAGRIEALGPPADHLPADAEVAELALDDDQTVMPGLIDLHAHHNMNLVGDGRVEETRYNPLVFLANGVTTTFPGGEYQPELLLTLRDRLEAGEWEGPRLIPSGPYYGRTRPDWDPEMTADEVREDVDYWVSRGVTHFKAKGAAPEHIEPLIERVHEHGGTVTGHLDSGGRGSTNSAAAIAMGIDRVEHILGGPVLDPEQGAYPVWNQVDTTDAAFREIVELFLDNEVYFNATITAPVYLTELEEGFDDWADEGSYFTPYVQERVAQRERTRSDLMSELYQAMKRTTLAFYNAGGGHLITLGTDNPSQGEFLGGFSAHRELHAFTLAGIPAASALRFGTINGARALGMEAEIGSIAPGKWADLVVVRGDPLADIRNTRNVEVVILEGTRHDPDELLGRARGQIGPSGPEAHDDWHIW